MGGHYARHHRGVSAAGLGSNDDKENIAFVNREHNDPHKKVDLCATTELSSASIKTSIFDKDRETGKM